MTRLPLADYLGEPRPVALRRPRRSRAFKSTLALPGVFEANPFRFPMGTVWTLKYEILCYRGRPRLRPRSASCGSTALARRAGRRPGRRARGPRPRPPGRPEGRRDRPAAAADLRLRRGALRLRERVPLSGALALPRSPPPRRSCGDVPLQGCCSSSRPPTAILWLASRPRWPRAAARPASRPVLRHLSLRLAGAAGLHALLPGPVAAGAPRAVRWRSRSASRPCPGSWSRSRRWRLKARPRPDVRSPDGSSPGSTHAAPPHVAARAAP